MKIENKRIQIASRKGSADGLGNVSDGERVQSSGNKQRMATAVVSYVDLEREVEVLEAENKAIERNIEMLSGNQYDVIYKHYVLDMSMKQITLLKGKSPSWARTIHTRALESLQEILDAQGI